MNSTPRAASRGPSPKNWRHWLRENLHLLRAPPRGLVRSRCVIVAEQCTLVIKLAEHYKEYAESHLTEQLALAEDRLTS